MVPRNRFALKRTLFANCPLITESGGPFVDTTHELNLDKDDASRTDFSYPLIRTGLSRNAIQWIHRARIIPTDGYLTAEGVTYRSCASTCQTDERAREAGKILRGRRCRELIRIILIEDFRAHEDTAELLANRLVLRPSCNYGLQPVWRTSGIEFTFHRLDNNQPPLRRIIFI